MQCVILAAGLGLRMRPLTEHAPKPLLEICNKPILWHIVNALPSSVDELVLVVGYKGDMIRSHCGDTFLGRPVTYVVQENPKGGTADALFCAQPYLKDRFLVMYGDDIHGHTALEKVISHPHGMLAARSEVPERFGVLELNADGTLRAIIEKPLRAPSKYVNIGGFVLSPDIFNFKAEPAASGEYFLTDCVTAYASRYPVTVVTQDAWIPIGHPEDVARAESVLCPAV